MYVWDGNSWRTKEEFEKVYDSNVRVLCFIVKIGTSILRQWATLKRMIRRILRCRVLSTNFVRTHSTMKLERKCHTNTYTRARACTHTHTHTYHTPYTGSHVVRFSEWRHVRTFFKIDQSSFRINPVSAFFHLSSLFLSISSFFYGVRIEAMNIAFFVFDFLFSFFFPFHILFSSLFKASKAKFPHETATDISFY